jgi:trans-2,3-dihydro-3-hydroxyanthranilate isomerase
LHEKLRASVSPRPSLALTAYREEHPQTNDMNYILSDVFTDRPFGGNPLAVFPDADGASDALMQAIARELNISECVFVFPPADPAHAARLRIFTPRMELPFAGHPTVGTVCTLLKLGRVREGMLIFEEAVGPIEVRARREGNHYFGDFTARQQATVRDDVPAADVLAEVLSLAVDDIVSDDLRPLAVSAGVPFLMIPVRDRAALARARVNVGLWEKHIANTWSPHLYVVTTDAELPGSSLRVRMFAPAMGITEDPATGGAATALPEYLAACGVSEGSSWRIEQGFEMGRPSLIDVSVQRQDDRITAVSVGGESVFVGSGVIDIRE